MITIDINSFWSEQNELSKSCIEFVESIAGSAEKITILKEVENDPESNYSVLLNYPDYKLVDFKFYDELMDFARENELYVIVFDHDTKHRKGYWYDEEEDWIEAINN